MNFPNITKNKQMKQAEQTKISARVIADSVNAHGNRLTTFIVTFPRMILAEFNTHRILSRNSASSRAIPFEKMVERVKDDPFIPIAWMKDHSGMQGSEYFTDHDMVDENSNMSMPRYLQETWLASRNLAVRDATILSQCGLTKQICNRLLEPFMWHTVIVTGSEWENFFALRAHPAAEIHMQKLAEEMLYVYNVSVPKLLKAGEWHIPFGGNMEVPRIQDLAAKFGDVVSINGSSDTSQIDGEKHDQYRVKIATARCARVSYLNYEGGDDYEADLKLHDRLAKMGHWSPFEHCARSMTKNEHEMWNITTPIMVDGQHDEFLTDNHPGWCGNFRGFIQYRKLFEGENRKDPRVIQAKSYPQKTTHS